MAKSFATRTKKSKTSVNTTKLGLFGASGRMGQEILQYAEARDGKKMYLAVSQAVAHAENVTGNLKSKATANVDVWIDFTSPEGFAEILNFCVAQKKPLLSGTTGLSPTQVAKIVTAAKTIPILWSPNMSLGVNILLKAIESLKSAQGFDFQIEEAHHRHKKDKPSGTAKLLQEKLKTVTQKNLPEPLAFRGGGIFGIHKIWAMADEEILTFEHTALNRRVFAKGAVEAAYWLSEKSPGLYTMQDLLST